MSPRTLWNFDPTLRSLRGHHASYARALADEAERQGWKFQSLVHRDCDSAILPDVRGERLFSEDIHAFHSRQPLIGGVLDWIHGNRAIYRSLRNVNPSLFTKDDVALFHTVTQNQIGGILKWWQGLTTPSRPHLVLLLRYSNIAPSGDSGWRYSRRSMLYRRALSGIRGNDAVTLATDSDGLAQEYKELLGWGNITVLPIPHLPNETQFSTPSQKPCLRIVSLGDARSEKGVCLISHAAKRLAPQHAELKFIIQSNFSADAGQPVADAVHELEALGDGVETLNHALSDDAYEALLKSADIVLAPYDPAVYKNRTSGIFSEALALGIPVIVTAGTWMESELTKLNVTAPVITSFDSEALIEKILELANDILPAKKAFESAREHWNSFHNPAHYFDMLDDILSKRIG